MTELKLDVTLAIESCCVCGIPFGIPDYHLTRLKDNGGEFFCPNGHAQHYTVSEIKRLSDEVDWYRTRWNEERADHQSTRRSLTATKAAHTRTKNRIKNGVCPCCNRQFSNLHRHMQTQHPDYAGDEQE